MQHAAAFSALSKQQALRRKCWRFFRKILCNYCHMVPLRLYYGRSPPLFHSGRTAAGM